MIRVRARNKRGSIRTDFGARWKTAPMERYLEAQTASMFRDVLLWGYSVLSDGRFVHYQQPEPGFYGQFTGDMLRDES